MASEEEGHILIWVDAAGKTISQRLSRRPTEMEAIGLTAYTSRAMLSVPVTDDEELMFIHLFIICYRHE